MCVYQVYLIVAFNLGGKLYVYIYIWLKLFCMIVVYLILAMPFAVALEAKRRVPQNWKLEAVQNISQHISEAPRRRDAMERTETCLLELRLELA